MAYPTITLKQCDYAQITQNKMGDLAMVYKPLQNLVKDTTLGNFTTEKLKFDRYNFQDMLIVDEFDGSTNIIVNDDTNEPRLINSGFSVQEDNTFLIPEHYTESVTNIYEDNTFKQDVQLLKLYNNIPKLEFKGFGDGLFKCGSYTFYFRLADSIGNMSNVIQHSSTIQVFIGENGSYKIRMGMQDESANKSIKFKLSGLDSGFDYVRVFYERTSSAADQASSTLFYMIDQNFPIDNGECVLTLTGEEQALGISLSDLKNEYADIASCKTQAIVDNTLFLANTSAYAHQYKELQHIAWCIYPTMDYRQIVELPDTKASGKAKGYYDPMNVYEKVGYWPDEYYRFGIVFIYNNNQLSPVFNIMGYDMSLLGDSNLIDPENLPEFEPDNYIYNKSIMSNSKGVVKTLKDHSVANVNYINFHLDKVSTYIQHTQDLTSAEKEVFRIETDSYDLKKFLLERHGIKGFFFVRQKRIPTTLAQGMVIGLTTKDHGSIPILKDGNLWKTKSFLRNGRLVRETGGNITTFNENLGSEDNKIIRVVEQALLVPDAELQEATFNQIFTSQEFTLSRQYQCQFNIEDNDNWWEYKSVSPNQVEENSQLVKLTAVPKDTKIKTNGIDYFSTIAGSAEEAYKTEDIVNVWNKTKPQDLTVSDTLIRGRWGYYVGMSANTFGFGDVVSIKKAGFINNPEQNLLEFQDRFNDYSFYSPVSTRYSIDELNKKLQFQEFGGDCFSSMFTHRMMTNFIDPELPTNDKIVNPGCWCENYAVRCTAEILNDTHSNLTGDSAGFYIHTSNRKSTIVSLIFGILTGNLGLIISNAKKLADKKKEPAEQDMYANEVAQAFEVYIGDAKTVNYDWSDDYDVNSNNALEEAAKDGKIKKINPKEQEQNASGLNLKAIFKSDDNWELHGVSQINRADINAVSFGQWITFPIRSSMNLALRDVDHNQATEEASFNKKRSFYPLEDMDIKNKLPDSNVINGAAKKTIHKNNYPAYKTVPFYKQEYFNRIYWSKPNTSDTFVNSYRMIYTDQYKEYNKEFGDITKILPLGNSLFICFDHGMGTVPVDRSIKTETEASPYLASRNVLPAQVTTLSKDFGSMWKNSVIQTPNNLIYGVDTVAKKIWRTNGQNVEFISDHYVTKFLNDFIDLSEFDYRAYQGHLDVKTHYNNFKHDVIFTLVKDKPCYLTQLSDEKLDELKKYIRNVWGAGTFDYVSFTASEDDEKYNGKFNILFGYQSNTTLPAKYDSYDEENGIITYNGTETLKVSPEFFTEKTAEIQNGKIYVNDLFTGILCDIEKWEEGTVWSLCYNEVLQKWTTFYDWYPVESCNVNNIFFSFDQESIDGVYDQEAGSMFKPKLEARHIQLNKYFIDESFTEPCSIYDYQEETAEIDWPDGYDYASYYTEINTYNNNSSNISKPIKPRSSDFAKPTSKEWEFRVFEKSDILTLSGKIAQVKFFNLPPNTTWDDYATEQFNEAKHLQFYDIRDYNPNRMYLWKHGQAGLYDNQGKIKPTHWYGKQHEFNFEFVVNENPVKQKIFNNLKLLSNKAAPAKFEYEVVGEGYEWFEYKPIVEWINKKLLEDSSIDWWKCVLNRTSKDIVKGDTTWVACPDFPSLFDEDRIIKKLPYLNMKHTDKKGTPERPHYKWDGGTDYWNDLPHKDLNHDDKYSYNCSEPCLVEDDQLNEVRLRTESLGNDMRKYGRVRGNMQYLEDFWNVEIRPVQITWCYLDANGEFQTKKVTETKHRDKYIKVKVRYSGEDLALIQAIYTIFEESYS